MPSCRERGKLNFALVFVKKVLLTPVNMYKQKHMQVLHYIVGPNLKLQHLRHLCWLQALCHMYTYFYDLLPSHITITYIQKWGRRCSWLRRWPQDGRLQVQFPWIFTWKRTHVYVICFMLGITCIFRKVRTEVEEIIYGRKISTETEETVNNPNITIKFKWH
jgi:hypothetical protein